MAKTQLYLLSYDDILEFIKSRHPKVPDDLEVVEVSKYNAPGMSGLVSVTMRSGIFRDRRPFDSQEFVYVAKDDPFPIWVQDDPELEWHGIRCIAFNEHGELEDYYDVMKRWRKARYEGEG